MVKSVLICSKRTGYLINVPNLHYLDKRKAQLEYKMKTGKLKGKRDWGKRVVKKNTALHLSIEEWAPVIRNGWHMSLLTNINRSHMAWT